MVKYLCDSCGVEISPVYNSNNFLCDDCYEKYQIEMKDAKDKYDTKIEKLEDKYNSFRFAEEERKAQEKAEKEEVLEK